MHVPPQTNIIIVICCSLFCEWSSVSLLMLISYVSLWHARQEKSPTLVHSEKKTGFVLVCLHRLRRGTAYFQHEKGLNQSGNAGIIFSQASTSSKHLQISSHRQTPSKRHAKKMKCFKHHPWHGRFCISLPPITMPTQVLTTAQVRTEAISHLMFPLLQFRQVKSSSRRVENFSLPELCFPCNSL